LPELQPVGDSMSACIRARELMVAP
jgi:hypothetical protein